MSQNWQIWTNARYAEASVERVIWLISDSISEITSQQWNYVAQKPPRYSPILDGWLNRRVLQANQLDGSRSNRPDFQTYGNHIENKNQALWTHSWIVSSGGIGVSSSRECTTWIIHQHTWSSRKVWDDLFIGRNGSRWIQLREKLFWGSWICFTTNSTNVDTRSLWIVRRAFIS